MIEHQVLVAGGGPTGMMLAAELRLAGIDVAIVERRPTGELKGARALGLQARSIEMLDQRGVAERFLSAGYAAQVIGFGETRLDISAFPTRHNYGLALEQKHIERLLLGWIEELGVPVHRNREVTGFTQDEAGVALRLADGEPARALYLVGCDGGRSVIRKAAGIGFPGSDPTISHILAEVAFEAEPIKWGVHRDASGMHVLARHGDGHTMRVMLTEDRLRPSGEPTLAELGAALTRVYGTDFGVHSPAWISRFTDMARQASSYREGRVLLAGDAAHVHYPAGGQGLNTGLQDAVNLGWKLAQVVKGSSRDSLLDTYETERRPVAAWVIRHTLAAVALGRQDERSKALAGTVEDLLGFEEPRRHLAGMLSGLSIRYELGEGHPLLGRRMPDLDLATAAGPLRLFALLNRARPLLLNLGVPGSLDIDPWHDRVQLVEARCDGPWELPVIGAIAAPRAVLVRPDGYVAWTGGGTPTGLAEALTTWFGQPAS